jgi:hypothetical protein
MAGGRTAPSRIADHTRHREVGPLEAIRQTIKTSAMIFTILIGATIFGYYMAMSKIPEQVELPLLLLTLQLTFPLITSLGFDPIWFGVLSMLMLSMGLVFPPVGMIAFVVASSANVSLVKVYTGTSILMIALVLTTVLLMVFPQIALWLPADEVRQPDFLVLAESCRSLGSPSRHARLMNETGAHRPVRQSKEPQSCRWSVESKGRGWQGSGRSASSRASSRDSSWHSRSRPRWPSPTTSG